MRLRTAVLCCVGLFAGPALRAAPPPSVDFDRDIHPILARACLSCHGAARHKGGLRLDDRTAALQGGNSGPVLKPGDAAGSRLLRVVAGLDPDLKMPPDGKTPLTSEEVARLRAWIEQGARWGRESGTTAEAVKSNHW